MLCSRSFKVYWQFMFIFGYLGSRPCDERVAFPVLTLGTWVSLLALSNELGLVANVLPELFEVFVLLLLDVIVEATDAGVEVFEKFVDDLLLSPPPGALRWLDKSLFSLLFCCVFIIDMDFPLCKRSLDDILGLLPILELLSPSLVSPSWSLEINNLIR